MSRTVVARWTDWSGEGIEHLVVRQTRDGVRAASLVLGPAGSAPFAAEYRILCDGDWRVRELRVRLVGSERPLHLSGDGIGRWRDHAGSPLPALEDAIDVDLTATPFTNTLPIRRLGLGPGQSETILVVYVELPELTVTTSRQRYTCLEAKRLYRFESLDSDFTRDIEVDGDGLVVTYPGLFRRTL